MKNARYVVTKHASAKKRLIISFAGGILVALGLMLLGGVIFAPLAAWDITALIYSGWLWATIWGMNASETKSHASTEDPSRGIIDILLTSASIASLIAVGFMIVKASSGSSGIERAVEVALPLLSVIISWGVVHTIYTVKYGDLYYSKPEGGVDFSDSPPRYIDFAYLAFTIGMTFQVSDTTLKTQEIRKTALKHALLSYLFGAVIIATTINTLASLGK